MKIKPSKRGGKRPNAGRKSVTGNEAGVAVATRVPQSVRDLMEKEPGGVAGTLRTLAKDWAYDRLKKSAPSV